jgi:protein phosphatase
VGNTIPARDLADALVKVTALRAEAVRCQHLAATGTPCGTTPTPAQSTVPTTPPTTNPTSPLPTPLPATPRLSPSITTPPAVALPADRPAPLPGVVA